MNDRAQLPPASLILQLAFVMRVSRALYIAAQLGIADMLADGAVTSAEIAGAA